MRSIASGLASALAAGLLGGLPASAGDVESELTEMKTLVRQLQQRVDAQQEQLEHQSEVLTRVRTEEGSASSGLASFLETLEIGGWVAGSYLYNFNDPDGGNLGGANAGLGGFQYPFHPDANSFSLDQLWFELERPIDESNRVGFRADIAFGKTASILGGFAAADRFPVLDAGGVPTGETVEVEADTSNDGVSLNTTDLEVYQAYIQYLAPIGNGVKFQLGKFGTTIGAEVAPTVDNFNITRGHVYNLFQPITHVGILASTEQKGVSASLGLVNSNVAATDIDLNNNKSILWHLGYAPTEAVSASFNGVWGSTDSFGGIPGPPDENNKELILDLILGWDPTERLSTYLNANWREVEDAFLDPVSGSLRDGDGWGVAIAGRYAITDRLGFALRSEYVEDSDNIFAGLSTTAGEKSEIYSLTGTLDYSLTEQLLLRAELRWDTADVNDPGASRPDDVFVSDRGPADSPGFEDDQLVGAVEVVYSF